MKKVLEMLSLTLFYALVTGIMITICVKLIQLASTLGCVLFLILAVILAVCTSVMVGLFVAYWWHYNNGGTNQQGDKR